MAMPVISGEKGKISYNESASYPIGGDFNGTFQQISTFDLGLYTGARNYTEPETDSG